MRVASIKLVLILLAILLYFFSSSWVLAQPSSFSVTGEVNLFANPSGNQIGKLIAGKKSTFPFESEVQSDSKGWVKIPLEGWIKKTSTAVKVGDRSNIRVITKKDNILTAPNKSVVAAISQGVEIEILEESKGWLKVRLIGWLPTTQTNLITLSQPQVETKVTPPAISPLSSESEQKISISPAIIEKLPSILERIAHQQETSESTLKLLKNLEERLKPLLNLDNQLKQQNEQQVTNTQTILEQVKAIQEKVDNRSILEQLQKIYEENKTQSQKGSMSVESVTSLSEKYLTIGIPILCSIFIMGIILWWLLYNRMNKLSGYSQFTEINQGLVRNTDMLQSLNTLTIRGLEETKGAVGLTIERNINELREYLLKQLAVMMQGMNTFFTQISQRNMNDFSEFSEKVSNHLVSSKTEISQLLTSTNQNLQTTFTNFGPVNFPVIAYEFAANRNFSESLAASVGNQKRFQW